MKTATRAIPDVAIVTGVSMALAGLYLLLGLAVCLIVGGFGLAFLGWRAGR